MSRCTSWSTWMDDLLIACKSIDLVKHVKAQLREAFEMRDLGESSFYLGFEIKRDRAARTLHISQKHYAQEVLSKFAMEGANGRSTPLDANVRLSSVGEALDTYVAVPVQRAGRHLAVPVSLLPAAGHLVRRGSVGEAHG